MYQVLMLTIVVLAKFIIFDVLLSFGENILHEHKFLLIEQKRETRQLTRKIIWNSYYMNSYESDYLFVPRQIYHKWSSIFDSFSSQVSPRSYHDFGNTLYSQKKSVHHRLHRPACTIIVCFSFFLLPCVLT